MIIIVCERCHKEVLRGTHYDYANDHSIWNHGQLVRNENIKDKIWWVCHRCSCELRGVIYREPIRHIRSDDDDWSRDGETMATDSWGGAGPDCQRAQG